jgi:hypothetical protein
MSLVSCHAIVDATAIASIFCSLDQHSLDHATEKTYTIIARMKDNQDLPLVVNVPYSSLEHHIKTIAAEIARISKE